MITIKNYNFDYLRYLIVTFGIVMFGILLKSFDKRPYVIIETILIGMALFLSLICLSNLRSIIDKKTIVIFSFLIYLFLYNLVIVVLRVFEVDISFYDSLFFSIQEFRLSTLGYYLPLIFIPLAIYEHEKFKKSILFLLKISIAYTIFEQLLSLSGFRTFFEALYFNSGVVTSNQIGLKSFGLYRIWGLVGSPQILGVFHVITLFYMLNAKENLWAFLSLFAVLITTSKTAYLILILLLFLYLLVNKKYLLFSLAAMIIFFISFSLYSFNEHLVYRNSQDYIHIQKLVQSIQGYFLLLTSALDYGAPTKSGDVGYYWTNEGPAMRLISYFGNNPLEIFFGKGITYSFMQAGLLEKTAFGQPDVHTDYQFYMGLTSDFYILTFFEQYGLFGILILIVTYLLYPIYKLFKSGSYIFYIPITFFLATLHYPPQISKLIMLFVGYSLWIIYLSHLQPDDKNKENHSVNDLNYTVS